MEFQKKLKIRLASNLAYLLLGAILMALYLFGASGNEWLFTFGFALIVIGSLGLLRHRRITKNEESLRQQEIAERDERNLSILYRAKSTAFGLYALGSAGVTIVLEIAGQSALATVVALNLCALVLLYRICWWFYQKRI